jgi:uroporphyrin-III C-methyltransferase/precorrin-2 dehydrogenase/sirohydrochlorin ferrochelatase
MSGSCDDSNFNTAWLPLQLKLQGRLVVLIGAGIVAARKASKIINTGAKLRIISPTTSDIESYWATKDVERIYRYYSGVTDVIGAFLVIAATDNKTLNAKIALEARSIGALVLRVDAPEDSDFAFPATLRRGALTISFATNTICPAYAKQLRQDAEWHYGYEHAKYLEDIYNIKSNPNFKNLPVNEQKNMIQPCTTQYNNFKPGSVSIVGSGPGDLGLLTVKAIERLRIADVVIYDALANPAIIKLFAPQAQHINAGKRRGNHKLNQDQINNILTDLAHRGLRVLRLKGGDPCLFGRTGEELRSLHKAKIEVEIIPGISSMTAIPAAIGIPLTDRILGHSVGAFSLHNKNSKSLSTNEWNKIANGPETLVLFMGRNMLQEACNKLIGLGRNPELPAALIVNGTLPTQETIIGTLNDLPDKCKEISTEGPVLIVVGNVISLCNTLFPKSLHL